jgi:hypothetical protein
MCALHFLGQLALGRSVVVVYFGGGALGGTFQQSLLHPPVCVNLPLVLAVLCCSLCDHPFLAAAGFVYALCTG